MKKIDKQQLRDLILNGISSEELNSKYDYSKIIDMSQMFKNCTNLKTVPLFDTSKVTAMSCMFENCTNLKTVPLFNTSNVINMSHIFYSCASLKEIPLLDISKVNYINSMFKYCISLEHLSIKHPDLDFKCINSPKLIENQPEDFI
ncbi:MAG: BspA family leucine-rich repeat surface protein [Bacilli bacterium]|nr:BspA family leucine-rich repeat surface protein [Bacilli bacterium]